MLATILIRAYNIIRFPNLNSAFDPWIHIQVADMLINSGHIDLEYHGGNFALHIILAYLKLLLGTSLLSIAKYSPIIFGAVATLSFVIFTQKLTKSYPIALITGILLGLISDRFVFATGQAWPEIIGLIFMGFMLYSWTESLSNKSIKKSSFSFVFFLALMFSHRLSVLIFILFLIPASIALLIWQNQNIMSLLFAAFSIGSWYLWITNVDLEFHQLIDKMIGRITKVTRIFPAVPQMIFAIVIISIVFLVCLFLLVRHQYILDSLEEIEQDKRIIAIWAISLALLVYLIIEVVSSPVAVQYFGTATSTQLLFKIVPKVFIFLLSFLGLFYLLKHFRTWQSVFLVVWMVIFLIILSLLTFLPSLGGAGYDIFRFIAYIYVPLCISAAIGIYYIFKVDNLSLQKTLAVICIIFIIFVIPIGATSAFMTPEQGTYTQNWLDAQDYAILEWMGGNLDRHSIVLADKRYDFGFTSILDPENSQRLIYSEGEQLYLYYNITKQNVAKKFIRQLHFNGEWHEFYVLIHSTMLDYGLLYDHQLYRPLTIDEYNEYFHVVYFELIYYSKDIAVFHFVRDRLT
jgi:hypothetical protein